MDPPTICNQPVGWLLALDPGTTHNLDKSINLYLSPAIGGRLAGPVVVPGKKWIKKHRLQAAWAVF